MDALLKKEIRTRMRGNAIFAVENIYLMLLAAVSVIALIIPTPGGGGFGWEIGKRLFLVTNYVQILLLVLASPTIVASTFTLEREQKTFDMLLATPLTIPQIVRAKLFASLSFFFVLVLVSFPMLSVSFIFGGVSPAEIFWAYLVTAEGILLAGAMGLCCSAYFKRTLASAPMSSLSIVIFLIATYIISFVLSDAIGLINPLYAFSVMTSDWTVRFFDKEIPFWAPNLLMTSLLFFSLCAYAAEVLTNEKRRTSIRPRLFLFLFFSVALVFLMGSSFKTGPELTNVIAGLKKYAFVALFVCIIQAIIASGGGLSPAERARLLTPWGAKYLRPQGWLTTGFFTGHRYSLLPALVAAIVLAVGVAMSPGLQYRFQPILAGGGLIIVCTMMYAMAARFFSFIHPTPGKSLSRILAILLFFAITFVPHLVSYASRAGKIEIPDTAWDILILASPITAMGQAIDPASSLESYPYCQNLLGSFPFPVVTILLYGAMFAIFWALSLLLERRIRPSENSG